MRNFHSFDRLKIVYSVLLTLDVCAFLKLLPSLDRGTVVEMMVELERGQQGRERGRGRRFKQRRWAIVEAARTCARPTCASCCSVRLLWHRHRKEARQPPYARRPVHITSIITTTLLFVVVVSELLSRKNEGTTRAVLNDGER
jgi:hypothetical protein